MSRTPGSLRALLANLIDYAGLYPPAELPLPAATANYARYLASDESWMLNRFILPAALLPEARFGAHWRISLLVAGDPGHLPPQVEVLESKEVHNLPLPSYFETDLDEIARRWGGPPGPRAVPRPAFGRRPTGASAADQGFRPTIVGFAKIRTGGITPDAIPTSERVVAFLVEAARRRIAFKATAGLHHPVRSEQPLTYAPDAPRAVMHGFLNVFTAAAFAWNGAGEGFVLDLLNETDPRAFEFLDVELRWRGRALPAGAIEEARRDFAHSFGSCSFEEPVAGLRALGFAV